jgi:hypothetical protein
MAEVVEGRSWLKEFAQAAATLDCDDFVRVYFSCRDRADLFQIRNVAAQPILSLGGLGEFDEFGTYPVSVSATPRKPLANDG